MPFTLGHSRIASFALASTFALLGCTSAALEAEDVGTVGAFLTDSDDETIDPSDPPTDPDPPDDAAGVRAQANGAGASTCKERGKDLSPRGLSFVIHVSDRGKLASAAVDHLERIRRFIRPRDIFMVERSAAVNARLRELGGRRGRRKLAGLQHRQARRVLRADPEAGTSGGLRSLVEAALRRRQGET